MGKGGPSWNQEGSKVGHIFQFVDSGVGLSLRYVNGGTLLVRRGWARCELLGPYWNFWKSNFELNVLYVAWVAPSQFRGGGLGVNFWGHI